MQKEKIAHGDFDKALEEVLRQHYRVPMATPQQLLDKIKQQRPNKKVFEKLQAQFRLGEARVAKLFSGWMHKAAEPWPKEVLDRVCEMIPEVFNECIKRGMRRNQLALIQDEVIARLGLDKEQYKKHDQNYLRRLIYGKTAEMFKMAGQEQE